MAFPFLFMTLALVSGIALSAHVSIGLPVILTLLASALILSWLFLLWGKNKICLGCTLLTVFFLGYALHSQHEKEYETNSLHQLESDVFIDFVGTVYRSPARRPDGDTLFLKVVEVNVRNEAKKIMGRLRVYVPHSSEFPSYPDWSVQDRIKVSARLISSRGYQNFHSSPLAKINLSEGIHNQAYTKSPLLVERLKPGNSLAPLRIIAGIRQDFQKKIEEHFITTEGQLSPEGAVLEALILGERGRMPDSVTQSLQKAGLYHLIAISGAHIAIISFLLFSVFRLARISRRTSSVFLIAFLVFYAFLVEGNPSVLRAVIMAIFYFTGKLLWRDVNLLNTLSLSAFFLLLINPVNLFMPGFQLTFAATLAIILFYPKIIRRLPGLPFKISEIFTLTLTAQLGVFPIVIHTFNSVVFSGFLLNCAAIPLVAFVMALGYIFFPLSVLAGFLAKPLASLITLLIALLCGAAPILDPVPFLSYRIPTPRAGILIGYYLFLALFLVPLRRKILKGAVALGFLAFFSVMITSPFPPHSQNLKITFIDVGQGDAILVEFPGTKKMLIDGGGAMNDKFDIGENVICPFLWRKGIKKIDYMVLSHAHPDHMNGLKAVARNFRVIQFWESCSPLNDEFYIRFRKSLSPRVTARRIFQGESITEGNVRVRVVHPPKENPITPTVHNNQSMVLRITCGRQALLLTGDIEKEIEQRILESSPDLESSVLKSPHHGSLSSSSILFLERIAPDIVVISVGKENPYGLPHPEVLDRYEQYHARVYRTDIHGAVEITTDGQEIFVRTAVAPRAD